jgi:signal peptidase I
MAKEIKNKKKLRKRKFKISKSTIYTIAIIIAIFLIWQFIVVPMLIGSISMPPVGHIPEVKRVDIKFVDNQLSERVLKNVPSLTPPKEDIGKKNPFE